MRTQFEKHIETNLSSCKCKSVQKILNYIIKSLSAKFWIGFELDSSHCLPLELYIFRDSAKIKILTSSTGCGASDRLWRQWVYIIIPPYIRFIKFISFLSHLFWYQQTVASIELTWMLVVDENILYCLYKFKQLFASPTMAISKLKITNTAKNQNKLFISWLTFMI